MSGGVKVIACQRMCMAGCSGGGKCRNTKKTIFAEISHFALSVPRCSETSDGHKSLQRYIDTTFEYDLISKDKKTSYES